VRKEKKGETRLGARHRFISHPWFVSFCGSPPHHLLRLTGVSPGLLALRPPESRVMMSFLALDRVPVQSLYFASHSFNA
jgi:hypothetical protein